jgi:hypothetical protein
MIKSLSGASRRVSTMQWFSSKILSSKPIQVGQRQLVIRSHAIQLALPFVPVATVWNRPYAIQVQDSDGQANILPVVDVTRIAQVFLLSAGVIAAMFVWRKNQ